MAKKRRTTMRPARRLLIERLEPRRVLDAQLAGLFDATIADVAAQSGEGEDPAAPLPEQREEQTFQSVEQLRDFLVEDAEERYEHLFGQPTWYGPWLRFDGHAVSLEQSFGAVTADGSYSKTNVQVQGVDEGDIVRTDGRYLYVNGDGEIVIVDTQSDSGPLQVVSRVDVEGQPLAIYLTEGRLTVISNVYPAYAEPVPMLAFDLWMPPWQGDPRIVLTVLDVTEPADPQNVGQIEVEGDLVDSRMIDDTLYLVSGDSFYLPAPEIICSDTSRDVGDFEPPVQDVPEDNLDRMAMVWDPMYYPVESSCRYETREEYWDRIGEDLLDLALPNFTVFSEDGTVVESVLLNAVERTYRPLHEDAGRLISVSAIDVSADHPEVVTSTGVPLGGTNLVYMSPQNLYMVGQVFDSTNAGQSTAIYRFALDSQDTQIDLVAEGRVPGRVLNQFSLDEQDGFLRIVTTQGWGESSESGLYVLEQTDERLDITGSVEDLAPGERLFSVRFVEDRAFVVTFGPTGGVWYDPLFTIDLSVPTDPQVQGELEIPGFSNYLQLIDGDFLVGLGRNADEANGRSLEPQVSLYDVSDFHDPQLADRLSFGDANGSWSEAFSEHLAVSYFPEYGILAIPLSTWTGKIVVADATPARPVDYSQDGLWVFQIDPAAEEGQIQHLGTIEHESQIRRSLRIGDRLYSISDDSITAHAILDPDQQMGAVYYGHPARDDYFTIDWNSEDNVLEVAANDWVPSYVAPWTITAVGNSEQGGSVAIGEHGASLRYTPAGGFVGWDSFTYTTSDGNGGTDEATVRIQVVRPDHADRMIELAKRDLADRLQVAVGVIDVMMVEEVDWPDGCLGLGEPAMACTMAVVAGYRITLTHDANEYVYHTDTAETVTLAETRGVEPLVQIRLEAVGQDGLPLSAIEAGQSFTLQVFVNDIREEGWGVFASYVDILYPHRLAEVSGEIEHADPYLNGLSGDIQQIGLIDEVGGFAGSDELGAGERLLASIPFLAKRDGTASFVMTPADGIGHDALLFRVNTAISWSQVALSGTAVEVLGSWQNVEEPTDINDDGYTTALDALECINELNIRGSRKLGGREQRMADAVSEASALYDVNGDGDLTPNDVLLVVNVLNSEEHAMTIRQPLARPLVAWVDWQSLEAEVRKADWASLAGIGLGVRDVLDLSHKIFAELDANRVFSEAPAGLVPMSAQQVRDALPSMSNALHAQASVDRVIFAADKLEANIGALDLHSIFPGLAASVDLDLAKEVYRDRLFAEISAPEFLDDVLA